MSETNGQANTKTILDPAPGFIVIQGAKKIRSRIAMPDVNPKPGDLIEGLVLAVGEPKPDFGDMIAPPAEEGATVLMPAGAGWNATEYLTLTRGVELERDEKVYIVAFSDVLCCVYEE